MTTPMSKEAFLALDADKQREFLGEGVKFERIRRVTGYLNPDVRTWNDGKQAELAKRVKHGIDY